MCEEEQLSLTAYVNQQRSSLLKRTAARARQSRKLSFVSSVNYHLAGAEEEKVPKVFEDWRRPRTDDNYICNVDPKLDFGKEKRLNGKTGEILKKTEDQL